MAARLTPSACRAGRAILGWSTKDLAQEAQVSPATIHLLEAGRPFHQATAQRIIVAFGRRGVEITNGRGAGARRVFEQMYPHEVEGEWRVLVKWAHGDPVELLRLDAARRLANEAQQRGYELLASALTAEVHRAERYARDARSST